MAQKIEEENGKINFMREGTKYYFDFRLITACNDLQEI